MTPSVDLYDNTYGNFEAGVLARVRARTYGTDIGQSGWVTADEFATFADWLGLTAGQRALDVACGSGGPALHLARLTGCRIDGVDINAGGIAAATRQAEALGWADRATFTIVDANDDLPFADATFDAIISTDAMCHLTARLVVLREWQRVLRPGGRALFTDPVVISGPVTSEELATRSAIGPFLFVPPGTNERLIEDAGMRLVRRENLSAGAAAIAKRWHDARAEERTGLIDLEGRDRFDGLQRFLATVHTLTAERRLSRIAYLVER
jgi:SAM-dependent methyltransferase